MLISFETIRSKVYKANLGPGYNDMVFCPYDRSHLIRRERLQYHLVTCGHNHPESRLEVCPFDTTHRIRAGEVAVSESSEFQARFPLNFLHYFANPRRAN